MTKDLRLPDFLGIGVVKAGTTWLHRNLYEHPELYLPIQKPIYFWDRHRAKGLESYSRIFAPAADRRCGEFTASYSVLAEATKQELRELIPQARLILLLREPRDRAWSEAKMELTLIQEREADRLTEDDYLEFLASDKCRTRGDYPAILRSWTSHFPRDQVFVGLYDDIQTDPQGLLARILQFLGVSVPDDWSAYPCSRRIFQGPRIEIPERCREELERMYQTADIEAAAHLSGLDLVKAWGYQ